MVIKSESAKGRTQGTIEPGDRFGALVVKSKGAPYKKDGSPRYWCTCDCGKRKLVLGRNLISEYQNSCGCARKGYVLVDARGYKCVETGTVFPMLKNAAAFAGTDIPALCAVFSGRRKWAGRHPETGEKLHWEYGTYKKKKFVGLTRKKVPYKVICVTTGKKYKYIKDAAEDTGVFLSSIVHNCNHKTLSAGIDPDSGLPLVWEWL